MNSRELKETLAVLQRFLLILGLLFFARLSVGEGTNCNTEACATDRCVCEIGIRNGAGVLAGFRMSSSYLVLACDTNPEIKRSEGEACRMWCEERATDANRARQRAFDLSVAYPAACESTD